MRGEMNMKRRMLSMSLTAGLAALGISLLVAANAAFADTPASPARDVPAVAPAQATAIPLNPVLTSPLTHTQFITAPRVAIAISTYFTVPVSQVVTLRSAGWGYGEIFKLYQLSLAAGKTVTEVKALRDAGIGWGNIAKQLNVHPGNAGVNLGAAMSDREVLAITSPNSAQPNSSRKNEQKPNRSNNGNSQNNPGRGNGGGQDDNRNAGNDDHGNGKPEKDKDKKKDK